SPIPSIRHHILHIVSPPPNRYTSPYNALSTCTGTRANRDVGRQCHPLEKISRKLIAALYFYPRVGSSNVSSQAFFILFPALVDICKQRAQRVNFADLGGEPVDVDGGIGRWRLRMTTEVSRG